MSGDVLVALRDVRVQRGRARRVSARAGRVAGHVRALARARHALRARADLPACAARARTRLCPGPHHRLLPVSKQPSTDLNGLNAVH